MKTFSLLISLLLIASCSRPEKEVVLFANIILILSDDMGFSDIGCYGSEIKTPALDNLAANGLRFSQFYNTARCCPTRASLITGLYPAQTGMGFMTGDEEKPGYRGEIGDHCVTIAEVLKPAGYCTYMAGKWHVARNLRDIDSLKYNWPLQRGFDRFYGTITGAGSYWDPSTLTRDNTYITPHNDPEYQPEQKWYYTDALSDNAVLFIEQHIRETGNDPFFLYVAYTAAHWPLHVPEEEIALHQGKYKDGFAAIREKRMERLKRSGLIQEDWELTQSVAEWDSLHNKDWNARNMEVYAAMISRMDKGIGKIVDKLKEYSLLDNTLVLFLQDNGGCAETLGWHQTEQEYDSLSERPVYEPMGIDELQTLAFPIQNREGYPVVIMSEKVMAGSDQTYHAYGPAWANVSNTPFREYKHWVHEGGVSTPLIVHWPEKILDKGHIRHQPAHLIDIMATLVDLTGAEYPVEFSENRILPMEGKSLMDVWINNKKITREAIFFEHEGNRAVRQGKWKLVSRAYPDAGKFRKTDKIQLDQWELFDMEADRTEIINLAGQYPEIIRKMATLWQGWAERTNTIPKPE
jgi:arylsulfatase